MRYLSGLYGIRNLGFVGWPDGDPAGSRFADEWAAELQVNTRRPLRHYAYHRPSLAESPGGSGFST